VSTISASPKPDEAHRLVQASAAHDFWKLQYLQHDLSLAPSPRAFRDSWVRLWSTYPRRQRRQIRDFRACEGARAAVLAPPNGTLRV